MSDHNIPMLGMTSLKQGPQVNQDVVLMLTDMLAQAKLGRVQGLVIVGFGETEQNPIKLAVGSISWMTVGLLSAVQIGLANQLHQVEAHMAQQGQQGGVKLQ